MISSDKSITCIRHGITEMNERMDEWGSNGFKDLELYDTKLSSHGIEQCQTLNHILTSDLNHSYSKYILSADLIAVSPLRRALQTAELVLGNIIHDKKYSTVSKIVLPYATERVYLSSDIGTPKEVMVKEFPHWDFSLLSDNPWWYTHDVETMGEYIEWRPSSGTYAIPGEPRDVYYNRMKRLKEWLGNREEKKIVMISHWGTIKALTGYEFKNLEVRQFLFDELLSEPDIDE